MKSIEVMKNMIDEIVQYLTSAAGDDSSRKAHIMLKIRNLESIKRKSQKVMFTELNSALDKFISRKESSLAYLEAMAVWSTQQYDQRFVWEDAVRFFKLKKKELLDDPVFEKPQPFERTFKQPLLSPRATDELKKEVTKVTPVFQLKLPLKRPTTPSSLTSGRLPSTAKATPVEHLGESCCAPAMKSEGKELSSYPPAATVLQSDPVNCEASREIVLGAQASNAKIFVDHYSMTDSLEDAYANLQIEQDKVACISFQLNDTRDLLAHVNRIFKAASTQTEEDYSAQHFRDSQVMFEQLTIQFKEQERMLIETRDALTKQTVLVEGLSEKNEKLATELERLQTTCDEYEYLNQALERNRKEIQALHSQIQLLSDELNSTRQENSTQLSQVNELRAQNQVLCVQITTLEATVASLGAALASSKQDLVLAHDEVSQIKDNLLQTRTQLTDASSEIARLTSQIKDLQTHYQSESSEYAAEKSKLEASLLFAEARLAAALQDIALRNQALEEADKKAVQLAASLATQKEQLQTQHSKEREALQFECQNAQRDVEALKAALTNAKQENSAQLLQAYELRAQNQRLLDENAALKNEMRLLNNVLIARHHEDELSHQKIECLSEQLRQLSRSENELQNALDAEKNMSKQARCDLNDISQQLSAAKQFIERMVLQSEVDSQTKKTLEKRLVELERDLEQARQQFVERFQRIHELEKQIINLERHHKSLQVIIDEQGKALKRLENENQSLSSQHDYLSAEVAEKARSISMLMAELTQLKDINKTLNENSNNLTAQLILLSIRDSISKIEHQEVSGRLALIASYIDFQSEINLQLQRAFLTQQHENKKLKTSVQPAEIVTEVKSQSSTPRPNMNSHAAHSSLFREADVSTKHVESFYFIYASLKAIDVSTLFDTDNKFVGKMVFAEALVDKNLILVKQRGLDIYSPSGQQYHFSNIKGEAKAVLTEEHARLAERESTEQYQQRLCITMMNMIDNVLAKTTGVLQIETENPFLLAVANQYIQHLKKNKLILLDDDQVKMRSSQDEMQNKLARKALSLVTLNESQHPAWLAHQETFDKVTKDTSCIASPI